MTRLHSGVIQLDAHAPLEDRLPILYDALQQILLTNGPDEAAVESLFFAKNASSALKLGHARGVIILGLKQRGLPIFSYPPALVKRSIVGGGRATKDQMQREMQSILGIRTPLAEDEADALAVAVCHLNAPPVSRIASSG